MPRKEREDRPD